MWNSFMTENPSVKGVLVDRHSSVEETMASIGTRFDSLFFFIFSYLFVWCFFFLFKKEKKKNPSQIYLICLHGYCSS